MTQSYSPYADIVGQDIETISQTGMQPILHILVYYIARRQFGALCHHHPHHHLVKDTCNGLEPSFGCLYVQGKTIYSL